MARRPLTIPRKKASQARSRATVDALIEATARILARDGFDRTNTNRISEEAGASVGSLYQYFCSRCTAHSGPISKAAGMSFAFPISSLRPSCA